MSAPIQLLPIIYLPGMDTKNFTLLKLLIGLNCEGFYGDMDPHLHVSDKFHAPASYPHGNGPL
jgi:hypothetical protein